MSENTWFSESRFLRLFPLAHSRLGRHGWPPRILKAGSEREGGEEVQACGSGGLPSQLPRRGSGGTRAGLMLSLSCSETSLFCLSVDRRHPWGILSFAAREPACWLTQVMGSSLGSGGLPCGGAEDTPLAPGSLPRGEAAPQAGGGIGSAVKLC